MQIHSIMLCCKQIIAAVQCTSLHHVIILWHYRINDDEVTETEMGQTAYCETQIASDSSARVTVEAIYRLPRATYSSSPVNFHTGHNMMK